MTHDTTPEKERWLHGPIALRELQRLTGISITRTTFYRWLQNGTIPARKLVSRYYVSASDVQRFAAESFEP